MQSALVLLVTLSYAMLVKRSALLPTALAITVLVPVKLQYVISGSWVAPAAVMILIWSARVLAQGPKDERYTTSSRATVLAVAYFLTGWFAILAIANDSTATQVKWAISFVVLVLVPVLIGVSQSEYLALEKCFIVLSACLGFMAVVEFYLEYVPLYSYLYELHNVASVQHWSMYRVESTFGHPLYAGTFFATCSVFSLGLIMARGRHWLTIFSLVGSSLGLALTASRGALLAAVFGIVFVLILLVSSKQSTSRHRAVSYWLVYVIALTAAVLGGSFADRLVSDEAQDSDAGRAAIYAISAEVARSYNYLGAGMGTSEQAVLRSNYIGLPIESSFWQLLVSVGLPGVLLTGALIGMAIIQALRAGHRIAAAILATFVVTVLFYNWVDDLLPQHLFLGILTAMCFRFSKPVSDSEQMPVGKSTLRTGLTS